MKDKKKSKIEVDEEIETTEITEFSARGQIADLVKGTPTKLILLDDRHAEVMKGNKAHGVGVALVGFLAQVNVVFDFGDDVKAAKEFFDQFEENAKFDKKKKRVVPL